MVIVWKTAGAVLRGMVRTDLAATNRCNARCRPADVSVVRNLSRTRLGQGQHMTTVTQDDAVLRSADDRPRNSFLTCRLCGSSRMSTFLDLGATPPRERFLAAHDLDDSVYSDGRTYRHPHLIIIVRPNAVCAALPLLGRGRWQMAGASPGERGGSW